MTNEELLSVAEIVERLSARFHKQLAEHEAKMVEHRAAFGARTEADAKIIAGLREKVYLSEGECNVLRPLVVDAAKYKAERDDLYQREGIEQKRRMDAESERDGLLTQVQDMRAERERLRSENQIMRNDAEDGYAEAIKVLGDPIALSKERDALRAEVAALQERLRASIARGDFAQMEVAALMSQTSKPCDQPVTVKREPEVGDMVQLVRVPTMEEYADWEDLFGGVGSLGIVKSLAHQVANVKYNDFTWEWPLSCIEVVTEATHDTEAGKKSAEAAVKTEPDEIKVYDDHGENCPHCTW